MKKQTLLILLFFISFTVITGYAQSNDIDFIYADLESNTLAKKNEYVITKVDSLVTLNKFSEKQNAIFQVYKVGALVESEKFKEALSLGNTLLEGKKLPARYEARIWIQQSLIYEIVESFEESFEKIELVNKFFQTNERDRYYGIYLYRKASLFRVQDMYEIGLPLALEAREFGELNDYKDVIATANFLIGIMSQKQDYDKRVKHYEIAIKNQLAMNDHDSAGYLYSGLARVHLKNDQLKKAKYFLFKALTNNTLYAPDSISTEIIFRDLANVYEKQGILDSALFYTKKANTFNMYKMLQRQRIKIDVLDAQREAMQRQYDVESVTLDYEQSERARKRLWFGLGFLAIVLAIITLLVINLMKRNAQIRKQRNDITERNNSLNQSLDEKNVLLKEVNHRVKNNLALIISLINFQLHDVSETKFTLKLKDLENRIRAIAMVHDQFIYKYDTKLDANIDLNTYVKNVLDYLISTSNNFVNYSLSIDNIYINMDTLLPIGILVNELINNSLKLGANCEESIQLNLKANLLNDKLCLIYSDNCNVINISDEKNNLELFIIESMVQQLEGTYNKEKGEYVFHLNLKK